MNGDFLAIRLRPQESGAYQLTLSLSRKRLVSRNYSERAGGVAGEKLGRPIRATY